MENGRLCPASIMICIEAYKYVFRIIINMITYRSLRYRHSSFSLVVKLWAFYPGDKTLRLFIYQLLRRTVLADNLSVDKTRERPHECLHLFSLIQSRSSYFATPSTSLSGTWLLRAQMSSDSVCFKQPRDYSDFSLYFRIYSQDVVK